MVGLESSGRRRHHILCRERCLFSPQGETGILTIGTDFLPLWKTGDDSLLLLLLIIPAPAEGSCQRVLLVGTDVLCIHRYCYATTEKETAVIRWSGDKNAGDSAQVADRRQRPGQVTTTSDETERRTCDFGKDDQNEDDGDD